MRGAGASLAAARAPLAAALALLAACGGSAGDLLAIEVSGGSQARARTLVVTGDGLGGCGRGARRPIPSERLIEARAVERDLGELAERGASFADGGTGAGRRSYVARSRAGTVRWTEGAPGLPAVLPRAALLAVRL